jgi:hypothetical protein
MKKLLLVLLLVGSCEMPNAPPDQQPEDQETLQKVMYKQRIVNDPLFCFKKVREMFLFALTFL